MTALVPLALISWIVLALVLFSCMPKHRAVIAITVLGVLFLPEIHMTSVVTDSPTPLSIPGFKLTKLNTISYALLLGSFFYDRRRWSEVRPNWFDAPMLVWCICPFLSSLSNDLGLYDAVSRLIDQTMTWGVPYWIGRMYFRDLDTFRDLVVGIILGAVIYMPLCWFENRMSPQLHVWVYGFAQHEFLQSIRFDGYRPMVFMYHGLVVSMWMVAAFLLSYWMWQTGALRQLTGLPGMGALPMGVVVGLLGLTCILCRSSGPLVLGLAGVGVLIVARFTQTSFVLALLLAVAPVYIFVRSSGTWSGDDLVEGVAVNFSEARAESLEFRFRNENMLVEKALERPGLGWGGWGRTRVYDESGKDISVTDGAWILALGDRGFLGLIAMCLAILLPPARFWWKVPAALWSDPRVAPLAAGAVLLTLDMINNLLNFDTSPVYLLVAGGMASVMVALTAPRPVPAATEDLDAAPQEVKMSASEARVSAMASNLP